MFSSRFPYYQSEVPISYTIIPDSTSVYEGSYITYTVTTTGVADGTILYWAASGTTAAFDFNDNNSSGTITINGNTGTLVRLVTFDTVTETDETITLTLYTGSVGGTVVGTSPAVTIKEGVDVTYYTEMSEGRSYNVQIRHRTNSIVFYWEIVHITTVESDFSATSGTVTVSGSSAPYSAVAVISPTMATEVEGNKTFRIRVRFTNSAGAIVHLTQITTLRDMDASLINVPTTVYENTYFSMTGRLLNLSQAMTAPIIGWNIKHGTTVDADFSLVSSNVTTTWNSTYSSWDGSFGAYPVLDALTETSETFQVELRWGGTAGNVIATTSDITLQPWTMSFTSQPTILNENAGSSFSISTSNLGNYSTITSFYWTILHGTTDSSDFQSTSGSFTPTYSVGSWTGGFAIYALYDLITESNETFQVQVRYGSTSGTIMATSDVVTIQPWTMSFTSQPTTMNENSGSSFSISTSNLNGTLTNPLTFYWTILHGTTVAEDFQSTSGSFTPTYSAGSWTGGFAIYALYDLITESNETFQVQVRVGSITGTIMATSDVVTIQPWTMSFTSQPTILNENSGTGFSISTSNLGNSLTTPTFYWTMLHGTTDSSDFQSTSGIITPTYSAGSWTGSFAVYALYDLITESNETFRVEVRVGSYTGTIMATSDVVTIQPWTMSFTSQPTTINENTGAGFSISTSNLGNTLTTPTFYWTILHGTTSASDFQSVSGSFIPSYSAGSWTGSIAVYALYDLITETSETFQVEVRIGSITGTVMATSNLVTIQPWTLSFTSTPTSFNEGSGASFQVGTSNLGNSLTTPTFYWTILHGTTVAADFQAVNGSFTPTYSLGSWTGSFAVNPATDAIMDLNETFQVEVRVGSITGTVMATSASIPLNNVGPSYIATSAMFTAAQGSAFGIYSTNGTTWTEVAMPSSGLWVDTNFNPGSTTRGVAVQWFGSTFAYTSNKGVSWSSATAPSSTSWYGCAAVTSTTWIAINDSNSVGHAYSTDNGATWTQGTLVTTAIGCAGNGAGMAVVVNGTLTLNYTTNGTSFTTVSLASNAGNITNFNKIEYVSGYWVVFSSVQGRYIYGSTNGINWTAPIDVTGGLPYSMRAISWNGTMWIIVCDNNSTYFTSTNFTTWTARTFTNARRFAGIAYIGTTWVVTCDGETASSNYKLTSTDGINWTETAFTTTNRRWMDLTSVK